MKLANFLKKNEKTFKKLDITMSKKTIEETYKKLTQRQHVLQKGEMYIGSRKKQIENLWVMGTETGKMEKKTIEYTPAFIKVFDEILTNATDHSFRDPTLTQIKVKYNKETGKISVWNNGEGIPVVEHKEHKIYVPELIFGSLLAGSNFNDSDKRIGAGTNGIGSTIANIYSKKFIIETVDSERKKKFHQEFSENMSVKSKPKITSNSSKSFTQITFIPDFKRFEMDNLENDTIKLIEKRVYECIATTNPRVSIYLNDVKIKGKGLTDYIKYFFEEEKVYSESYETTIGDTKFLWDYAIVPHSDFEQISFVNGNATINGGTHVNNIIYQIINKYKKMLEEKKKLKELKPNTIKDKLFFFLRATVINPTFNSQSKEELKTPSRDFGCNIEVSDKFIEKIYKSPITDEIIQFCKIKESATLSKKTDGKKVNKLYNIPKLEDAIWAGTAKSDQCTFILTEGESAKTFAMWGRSVVGSEKYGILSLKGKVLNTRDATIQQLMSNEELNNIKQIIGLKQDKVYENTKDLRYGKIMILTDSDVDGLHIKSLLINFIHHNYPSLLKISPNFISTLRTPIVKAIKGKKVLEFFSEQDYHKWVDKTENINSYQIKYFKGLGTSKKEDAIDTFKRLEELKVDYYFKDEKCNESILLAFEKDKNVKKIDDGKEIITCSDKRKNWLRNYNKNDYVSIKENKVSFQDLINKELIHFSIYDNTRSIPSICDGFKPSQRKIMYYMLKNNITKSIKVAQLSGYISAEMNYHHGEVSLQGAIIGMAQNFTGSNNINLLYPDGNFGSSFQGGKDSASPRYIYTKLEEISKVIFNSNDIPVLNHQIEENVNIEPEFLMPILPMILVNGCSGIATGFSTFIPQYNPKDINDNLKRLLENKEPLKMKPWFRNYNGIVEEIENGHFQTKGKWTKLSDTQIKITELPIGMGITNYKEFLESLIKDTKKDTKENKTKTKPKLVLKDIINKTIDENRICFIVDFENENDLTKLINSGNLEKELKLLKKFSTNNMYLFNENLILTKFADPNEILKYFFKLRLEFFQKRKEHLISTLSSELLILESKMRFIKMYINGSLDINRKSNNVIIELLEKNKFIKQENTFDYLLRIPIGSLSLEKINQFQTQVDNKKTELEFYKSKTKENLYNLDLENFSNYCVKFDKTGTETGIKN